MKKRLKLSVILIFSCISWTYSQYTAHEVGITTGLVSFQSDYGQSGDFKSTTGNIGVNFGLIYLMDFSYNRGGYFSEHFKIKAELSMTKVGFEHHGKWVDSNRTSTFAKQLRAMNGSTTILNLGAELVWFPLDLSTFNYSEGTFSPYLSAGIQANFYTPEVKSDLGPMGSPLTTPVKYMGGYTNDGGTTYSVVGSIGTRYKLSRQADLVVDLRAQMFNSDWVDGLNPDNQVYKENKSNDFLVAFSVGYVFLFD